MLFASDMPTHTHKNGALRALIKLITELPAGFAWDLETSQYFAFWLLLNFWPGAWLLAAGC
jgi:hypothetical protein